MMNDELETDDALESCLHCRTGSTFRSYLELMRLPNVFTAMADVAMGFLFVQPIITQWDAWALATLMLASSLLYISGVVLNDVFDLETDRQERPERPLPSGRVSLTAARWLGWKLLVLGVLLGTGVVFFVGHLRPGVVAALLATAILLYDAWLKRTPVGPLAMGACRTLNVLLGMTVVETPLLVENWLVAGGIGVYVAGVTWFARREAGCGKGDSPHLCEAPEGPFRQMGTVPFSADESGRLQLTLSTLVMILGIAMLAWFPSWSDRTIVRVQVDPRHWYLLTGLLGLLIVWRCFWAVIEPVPARVRMAVAQCVLSIIMLDAVACYAIRGVAWACLILVLLVPAMFLGRWIETT